MPWDIWTFCSSIFYAYIARFNGFSWFINPYPSVLFHLPCSNHIISLQWRHNECDGISNQWCLNCLLNVWSGTDQRKHQSPVSLAFVRGNHWWPVNSPHKGPVTRKMFPFDVVIMYMIAPMPGKRPWKIWIRSADRCPNQTTAKSAMSAYFLWCSADETLQRDLTANDTD